MNAVKNWPPVGVRCNAHLAACIALRDDLSKYNRSSGDIIDALIEVVLANEAMAINGAANGAARMTFAARKCRSILSRYGYAMPEAVVETKSDRRSQA